MKDITEMTLHDGTPVGNLIFTSRHNAGGSVSKTMIGAQVYSMESVNVVICANGRGEIMYNSLTRIPSHMNVRHKDFMPAHFRMSDLMLDKIYCTSVLGQLARAMGIVNDFICSGPRKNLKNSDLYHLRIMLPHNPYTKQEMIPIFLSQVSEMVRLLTSDPHPVIVASPEEICTRAEYDSSDIEMVKQMLLDAGFQPVRKNSKWYYLSK